MSDWRLQPGYGGGFEPRPFASSLSSQEAPFSGDPAFLVGLAMGSPAGYLSEEGKWSWGLVSCPPVVRLSQAAAVGGNPLPLSRHLL